MSAVLGRRLVRLLHHGHCVPAHVGLEALLQRAVTRIGGLLSGGNGVDVSRVRLERQVGAGAPRVIDQSFEQEVRAVTAAGANHRVDGFEPLAGFFRILVLDVLDVSH